MLMTRTNRDSLFDDLFNDFPFFDNTMQHVERRLYGHNASRMMSTDIRETEDGYQLIMDLPGFKTDELQISLEHGYLTISAAKGLDQDEENQHFIRRERYAGSCSRSFYVGENIPQEQIKAEFRHGILTLQIPRAPAAPELPEKKYIAIEEG